MKTKKTLIILFLISMSVTSYAQKKISGEQSGTLGPGKYIVTGNIKIEAEKCLTIAPGTTFIHESGNYIWEIYGSFKAIGTQKDSIYFLSKEGVEQNKHWSGLRFLEGAPAATLDYCVVDNCYLDYSDDYISGVNVSGGKRLTLTHSRISNCYSWNFSSGVYVANSVAFINHCKIINNAVVNHLKGPGIYLKNCKDSQIFNSVIAYNHSVGGG
jgi:hypothetical protein